MLTLVDPTSKRRSLEIGDSGDMQTDLLSVGPISSPVS